MRITAHVLLVGLAFVLSSCSGAKADPNLAPGDFREIAIDEPMMTPDPSGTFAVLTVATSIDAICAVAYGETEALGSLATDLDMRGGGHDDHNARLTGLAPDTRYFYRLQGIGPSGRLFQSEVMEFRTPTAAEGSLSGEKRRRRSGRHRCQLGVLFRIRWPNGRRRESRKRMVIRR